VTPQKYNSTDRICSRNHTRQVDVQTDSAIVGTNDNPVISTVTKISIEDQTEVMRQSAAQVEKKMVVELKPRSSVVVGEQR
jgi:hypothetical protein